MWRKISAFCAFAISSAMVCLFVSQSFGQKPKPTPSKATIALKVDFGQDFNLGSMTFKILKEEDPDTIVSCGPLAIAPGKRYRDDVVSKAKDGPTTTTVAYKGIEIFRGAGKNLKDVTGASGYKFESMAMEYGLKYREVTLVKSGEECFAFLPLRAEGGKLVMQYKPLSAPAPAPPVNPALENVQAQQGGAWQLVSKDTMRVPAGLFNVGGIQTGWSFNQSSPQQGALQILVGHVNNVGGRELKLQWNVGLKGKHVSEIENPAEFEAMLATDAIDKVKERVQNAIGVKVSGPASSLAPIGLNTAIMLKDNDHVVVLEPKAVAGNILAIEYKAWTRSANAK